MSESIKESQPFITADDVIDVVEPLKGDAKDRCEENCETECNDIEENQPKENEKSIDSYNDGGNENGLNGRRSDEPVELSFEKFPESKSEKLKRKDIEEALKDAHTTLEDWQQFAKSEHGLINDDLRKRVWPLLMGVDPASVDPVPTLEELKIHPEYNQVLLDVNRSLKRFPPGIPYEQRIALQDQLTVLILRVIMKYPDLRYYQGYHDVAITFLLVVGEEVAFHVMEILSTNHLKECMQETMEPTQQRLMCLFPIIRHENSQLCDFLEKSCVGTLFALPWYLTWFGHSLNQYRAVVRLYDYFLASHFLLPLYVTAAIVIFRQDEIFKEECDMAMIHCLLSSLPDDLPFEYLLTMAEELFKKYPQDLLEEEVKEMMIKEKQKRIRDEEERAKKRAQIQRRNSMKVTLFRKWFGNSIVSRRSIIVTTFSIFIGICAFYYKSQLISVGVR